jgi:hypothetical protein
MPEGSSSSRRAFCWNSQDCQTNYLGPEVAEGSLARYLENFVVCLKVFSFFFFLCFCPFFCPLKVWFESRTTRLGQFHSKQIYQKVQNNDTMRTTSDELHDLVCSSSAVASPAFVPPPIAPPIYEKLKPLSDGGSKQPQVIALGFLNGELCFLFLIGEVCLLFE